MLPLLIFRDPVGRRQCKTETKRNSRTETEKSTSSFYNKLYTKSQEIK